MLNYNFQDSFDRIDWSTGNISASPTLTSQYHNGFTSSALLSDALFPASATTPDTTKGTDTPDSRVSRTRNQKKGKVLIWILLILVLIALGFWGFSKLKS